WRSVKYEEVYLKAYSNVLDAKKQLNAYFEFYNLKRPHSSLDKSKHPANTALPSDPISLNLVPT
uniref:integrase core domain-containing protein n=1 Tax=Acinetobacter sp. YH12201 TaxID=2601140 RepID=UPI00211EEB25